ncbi:MAG: homocysteine S-methyltransferase [Myxococcales bacterium]|nr:MAG: homocysteine S-methyltransferase [Myxococcales bacterium]
MARYRDALPQLSGDLFLTDGGIETTLIFHEGLELPDFAAFVLLRDNGGRAALEKYFRTHAAIATRLGVGFVLESATWRASPDWAQKLGFTIEELADANRQSIELLGRLRGELEGDGPPMVISGCIGPRGDGYDPAVLMGAEEAEDYHCMQARLFADTDADMVTAVTMTHVGEAAGVARAARAAGMPVVISFTVETDGSLPSGQPLADAIVEVDSATDAAPAYYMINCAHPTHFSDALDAGASWTQRIRGIRANASRMSHAELDEATELDDGDPAEFASLYRELRRRLHHINVLGGCCGTDHRHIEAVGKACID